MLIQNGFQYNEHKPKMKNEKIDIKVKEEFADNDSDFDFHDYDQSNVKYEFNNVDDPQKTSASKKRKQKDKKSHSKRKKTKSLNKNIPETSAYNVKSDLLASNDNSESLDMLNNIASMIPNDPSVDFNIENIIKNIESKVQNDQTLQSVKVAKPTDDLIQIYELIDSNIDLIDTETKSSRRKSKRNKTFSLGDELVEQLKKEEETCPTQKKQKTSSVDLDQIYNILDTKIDILDISDKSPKSIKDITGKERKANPRWSAERIKTFWSLAVEPFTKNERVQCKICHKFTKYSCFTRHAVTHFEPEFTCEVCGNKLMSKKNLSDHQQRKHGVTKNFACAQCDYRSVLPGELQNHVRRVHTGERPYICDLCSESFYQRRCLVAHMRCHYAEKKYQCDRCSNMFKTQSALTAHYNRYHIMRYTFYCDHCSYQVSKSSKVKDHLTKVHGIPREKQPKIKFFKERREESLYGETSTKHLRKPEDVVKKISYKY